MSGYIDQEEGRPAREASESIDWCSPLWVPDGVREALGSIDLDPCANPGSLGRINAAVNYYLPDHGDGLADPWGGDPSFFVNKRVRHMGRWIENVPAYAPRVPLHDTTLLDLITGYRPVKNGYSNPPFGTYYFHAETKEILVPKDFNKRAEELVGGGNPKTAKDGEFRMTAKDWKKAVDKQKKALLADGWERHTIADWVNKAANEAEEHGLNWVHLGPAAVDTAYWHNTVEKTAAAVLFIKGRLKFELVDFKTLKVVSTGNAAPMPCALVLWTKDPAILDRFYKVFNGKRGAVHILESGAKLGLQAAINGWTS